jgi:hypothetical protein
MNERKRKVVAGLQPAYILLSHRGRNEARVAVPVLPERTPVLPSPGGRGFFNYSLSPWGEGEGEGKRSPL